MPLKEIRPMLYTKELKATIEFYTRHLGFTCGEFNEEWQWAAMHRDKIEFMLAYPNEHVPFERPGFTGTFYIISEDVDALWEELKDKAEVVYPIENFEHGMREFAIKDNNGYMLQFGQEIPQ